MNDTSSFTAETIVRPAAVDYLITDYGKHVGLESLAFNDDQMIVLELDGVDLIIEYISTDEGFLFQSILQASQEPVPSSKALSDGEIHRTLNHLNVGSFREGKGIVFVAPESTRIIWMDRQRLENLTVEQFDLAIRNAINNIRTWSEVIQSIQESPVTTEDAIAFSDFNSAIRI